MIDLNADENAVMHGLTDPFHALQTDAMSKEDRMYNMLPDTLCASHLDDAR